MRFIWLTEGVTFRKPREVLRFLYLHEWMHWYLHRQHGRGLSAETTCDRFALLNYRKREVGAGGRAGGDAPERGSPRPGPVPEPRHDLVVQDPVRREDRPAVGERPTRRTG